MGVLRQRNVQKLQERVFHSRDHGKRRHKMIKTQKRCVNVMNKAVN